MKSSLQANVNFSRNLEASEERKRRLVRPIIQVALEVRLMQNLSRFGYTFEKKKNPVRTDKAECLAE